ncbi:dihydrodipicolinate synthase family protein [Sphaerisporangium rubeum]|uniref:4-hydroxy-tetrahydrodipicolinate synthase n=1 Tax=Sphaerisporangium rubeum TaxID=321317 RepID=A0A7X0IDP3_9ACTN|nr:4-hydroxy-tetrahydrodipicolinate synthase [Sphaerisporangium rubeum]
MIDEVRQALASVVAVPVTPFDEAGHVDEPAYGAVVERMVAAGVGVVTANGNTGEFYSLSAAELSRVVELTVREARGAVVVAGVGHDTARAVEMAREAAGLGAHAVMVHQPVHPYQTEDGWVAYHRAVADAVPGLGVVCYVRSPLVTARAIGRLAAACGNVTGVKYAVPDPPRLAELAGELPGLVWVCGLAEGWAPFLWPAGARGFTSGLAVIAPELSLALLARLRDGETAAAMELWRRLKPVEDLRARHSNGNNVSVLKEALAQLGVCRRDVRPPISELPDAERAEVSAALAGLRLDTT